MKLPFSNFVPSTAKSHGDSPTKPTPSQNTSSSHLEKETPLGSSRTPSLHSNGSQHAEKKVLEASALQEAEALDHMEDEAQYPTGAKLNIITASLCLSVFLMALVSGSKATQATTAC